MKKRVIICIIIVIVLMLLPIPKKLNDGGSVEFKAIFYSIIKYHKIDDTNQTQYFDGIGIKIFGKEIYTNVKAVKVYTQTDYIYKALEEIPQNYTLEQAINDNCYVVVLNKIYNEKIYIDFIENVNNKKDGYIRAIYFTEEGDMIIKDIEFENDKNEFYVSVDCTRDNYSSIENRKISKYKFTKIFQESNENGEYTYCENEGQNDKLLILFRPIETGKYSFYGKVVESNSNYIIVKPNEDEEELMASDKFYIFLGDNNDMIYMVGTNVKINYTGLIQETYPAQIDAISIKLE